MNEAAVRGVADDDVPELLGGFEAALDVELVIDEAVAVLGADRPGGGLDVLRLDRGGDVGSGNAEAGHPQRIKPDAHRILLRRHDVAGRDAVDAADRVFDVGLHIVVELHHAHR